jgi:hypothetical protein
MGVSHPLTLDGLYYYTLYLVFKEPAVAPPQAGSIVTDADHLWGNLLRLLPFANAVNPFVVPTEGFVRPG